MYKGFIILQSTAKISRSEHKPETAERKQNELLY